MKIIRICCTVLLLLPALLQAGTIYLRDGQVIRDAQNLREFDTIFLYETNSRSVSVSKDRIQRVEDSSGKVIYELIQRTLRQQTDARQKVIFDILINGEVVGVGEWYEEGKFRMVRGRVPDGVYIENYPSGRIKREYTFANGTLNGACREYYASGIIERESTMQNGLENGISKNYHQSGQLKGEAQFRNGEKHGPTKLYYERGSLRSLMNFENGKVVGNQQVFYESGQVEVEVAFRDGIKHGPIRQYYETGNLKMMGEFRAGQLEGEVVNYYESGRVKERLMFRNGRIIER